MDANKEEQSKESLSTAVENDTDTDKPEFEHGGDIEDHEGELEGHESELEGEL